MTAIKKTLEHEPGEAEMLLPWHAAGTLNPHDAKRVEDALVRDPRLATQYAAIQEEYAETIDLNENLGAPSARAMQKLFAAIDHEPPGRPTPSLNISARVSGFFARLSPRTLAWSASLGAVALLLQAGVIGAILVKNRQQASFHTAPLSPNERAARQSMGAEPPPRALVRFAPDARVADIAALLDGYHASIIDTSGGLFQLQFGNRAMSAHDVGRLMGKLQSEKIVNRAVTAP